MTGLKALRKMIQPYDIFVETLEKNKNDAMLLSTIEL